MNSTYISKLEMPVRAEGSRLGLHGLASGVIWTISASIAAALSQWMLLMVTAKLATAEIVGQLAMSLAIVAPIQALTDLALRPALATDARGDFAFRDYMRLRGVMITIFLAIVGAVAFVRGGPAAPIIIAIGLQKAIESVCDLFFGLFQRADRLQWMGQSVVMRSTLASLAFLTVMMTFGDLLVACLAGLLVRIGVLVLHDLGRVSALTDAGVDDRAGENRSSKLFRASLPLAVAAFLMSFTVNIPRYVLEKRSGVAMLGVFAALVYLFQAGAIFVDAVGQAACSRLSQFHMLGNEREFHSLLFKFVAAAAAVAGCGVLVAFTCGQPLLMIVYSPAFATQTKTFLWLSVCAVPWYCSSVLGYGLVAKRQMKALFVCQLTSLLATLAGAYWLIGADGLLGACEVVFLTYSVQLGLYLLILWRVRDGAEVFPSETRS